MASVDLSHSINPPTKLLAAIDMGTNSFKMLLVRAQPNGKFISIDRFKEPVVLGRGMISNSPSISSESQIRAIYALQKFGQILKRQQIDHTKIMATSAIRESQNKVEFLSRVKEEVGIDIQVLSGEEEARFVYMGVLQFLPVHEKTVLAIDIGGGSTEFVIGKQGKVIFATSLKLGHVTLTDQFVKNGEIVNMRNHIRSVFTESKLIEKIHDVGFDIVVGSSGTIRSIEKAVFLGFGRDLGNSVLSCGELRREWRFNREELSFVVEKLCCSNVSEDEEIRRVEFFKRRSEFIIAGAVLLLEIFEVLKISEMEVSEYALGEGVIAETLASCCEYYEINANARWRSVTRLATRFNTGKKLKSGTHSADFAKELFEGLRKRDEIAVPLDEKDLEHLAAACLLHNIGLFIGKKGYHKHSYNIIKNGGHLNGYSVEEVELIALLVRHHRKKILKSNHDSLSGLSKEGKEKFRILCALLRLAVAVQHCQCVAFQRLETSNLQEGFRLVFSETTDQPIPVGTVQPTVVDVETELKAELAYFREVTQMKISAAVS